MLTISLSCRLNQNSPLSKPVSLGSASTLKLVLTAKDNGNGKRPHQAFLVLQDQDTGLEAPFPLTVKESGKATVQIVRTPASQNRGKMTDTLPTVAEGTPRPIAYRDQTPQGICRSRLLRIFARV